MGAFYVLFGTCIFLVGMVVVQSNTIVHLKSDYKDLREIAKNLHLQLKSIAAQVNVGHSIDKRFLLNFVALTQILKEHDERSHNAELGTEDQERRLSN